MHTVMAPFLETYMRGSIEMRRRANIRVPEGYQFSCFEDFILRQGHLLESSALTEDELELVRETLEGCRAMGIDVHERQQCFANSQSFVLHAETDDFAYYEGYAVGRIGFPVHHGWVELNGKVIDLTWTVASSASRDLLPDHPMGELPEPYAYWGVRFEDMDYVRHRLIKREMIGSLIDDWEADYPLLRGIDPNDRKTWGDLFSRAS